MKKTAKTTVAELINLGWIFEEGYTPDMEVILIADIEQNILHVDFNTENPDVNFNYILSDHNLDGINFIEVPETDLEKMF